MDVHADRATFKSKAIIGYLPDSKLLDGFLLKLMEEISRLVHTLASLMPEHCAMFGGMVLKSTPNISQMESCLIESASIKRQREFACGRYYAHRVLQNLGCDVSIIGRDEDGCPQWPEGIVGSISHTDDYCIAAAGMAACIGSIGIDLERSKRLKPRLWHRLFNSCEIAKLNDIADPVEQQRQATIIFSAKEAFYKCTFPLRGKRIVFAGIEICLEENNVLKFIHTEPNTIDRYQGFYCSGLTHVLTAVIPVSTTEYTDWHLATV